MTYHHDTIHTPNKTYECIGGNIDYTITNAIQTTSRCMDIIATTLSPLGWFVGTKLFDALFRVGEISGAGMSPGVALVALVLTVMSGIIGMIIVRRSTIWLISLMLDTHTYVLTRKTKIYPYKIKQSIVVCKTEVLCEKLMVIDEEKHITWKSYYMQQRLEVEVITPTQMIHETIASNKTQNELMDEFIGRHGELDTYNVVSIRRFFNDTKKLKSANV